ncbi:MAG: UDP-N-acetylglucosamine 2-epimerase (non-hydrolyzing) [Candidatus Scalindua sp. AMX11]|nr:MAG: UDP-N-acetylglucosamine 2-epimerase (non-hydrolyzing) [Candidatus Scalindua sp.]NOG82982.1 UDP-N-acetylglucosamine 2-epimerase (non-hydrolyzing) [Planctomycetota bacterium]RZV68044.1 MAG: UDP-N-acetylglucosamine 2-epimerase (non-hydrolyzing) [Candidatus Scalindua sp. SCAELEC01]TDE63735.1 MAG: UDP-N-acetylglucosamine 2-epimerase (non-hydrolyzing) [Candidatus Scalindua sp. AMX11]GJQ60481.1 MAG: UDP-N-acetyl glucosamine 2-epimerase [Candidatus Scalindua sp.]
MKKKILIAFGTRPEAIKMAPLVRTLKQNQKEFITKICVTVQHREMLDQVLDVFNISPDYCLDIMRENQDLFYITSSVLLKIKEVLLKFKPDIVLVQGDTTTAFSVALASFYLKIRVGHVEAGLRTFDLNSPWPEEANRQLTTRLVSFHFSPTLLNRDNLLKDQVPDSNIVVTGNTVIDALNLVMNKIKANRQLKQQVTEAIMVNGYDLQRLEELRKLILVTGHRRESFGEGIKSICNALKTIAVQHPDTDIVYPVHPNPNVKKPVCDILKEIHNVFLIEPLSYEPFVYLMGQSYLIISDSGGIQEEAPSLGIPVLVTRNITERPEAVDAGTVKLVGTDSGTIISETFQLLTDQSVYEKMASKHNPYGDGHASHRIIDFLKSIPPMKNL